MENTARTISVLSYAIPRPAGRLVPVDHDCSPGAAGASEGVSAGLEPV